uniref:FHA domain-containing protein n=1 Tax=Rhizochromulina marina TaxID=1034831 RepID=A0A7S2RXC8_9STRA|mmetsp:Transcript_22362/g.65016  ORF Transcript_22362/g.65016 Transcript_22362/m.65016 type:complete len:753 (+) Transcript_22362:31-2289(+)
MDLSGSDAEAASKLAPGTQGESDGFAVPVLPKSFKKPEAPAPAQADSAKPSQVPAQLARYSSPDWAAQVPPNEAATPEDEATPWSFEILKNGMPLSILALGDKAKYVVGRAGDVSDIVLEHPSISRAHAVLQFNRNGTLWLYDLNSTHGTRVNKRKVSGGAFEQLRPGDVVSFGESTRLYLLNGPEQQRPPEMESENLRKMREKLNNRRERREAKLAAAMTSDAQALAQVMQEKNKEVERDGISWGMQDAPEDDEEGAEMNEEELPDYLKGKEQRYKEHATSLGQGEFHSRDEKLWSKLHQKVGKANRLQEENRKILSKEGGHTGLSDGQRAHVVRNDERIAQLQEEVEALEEQIRSKNTQREETKANSGKARTGASGNGRGDSDEDEFYDRTKSSSSSSGAGARGSGGTVRRIRGRTQTMRRVADAPNKRTAEFGQRGGSGGGAETVESLTAQQARLLERRQAIEVELKELAAKAQETPGLEPANGGADDALDAFMASNEELNQQESATVLKREQADLEVQLNRVQSLLRVAAPALSGLKSKAAAKLATSDGATSTASPTAPETTPSEPTDPHADQQATAGLPKTENCSEATAAEAGVSEKMSPPAPVPRQTGPADPPSAHEAAARPKRKIGAPLAGPATKTKTAAVPPASPSATVEIKPQDGTSSPGREQDAQEFAKGPAKRPRVEGPSGGSPPNTTTTTNSSGSGRSTQPPNDPAKFDDAVLEGGELNWKPPEGQSGDGRTHLNEKFGY